MIGNFGNNIETFLKKSFSLPDFQENENIDPVDEQLNENIEPVDKQLTDLQIEELTLRVFVDLQSAIDGCKRPMRVVKDNHYDQEDVAKAKKELKRLDPTPQSIRIGHIIYHLLSTIGYIFLGYEFFNNKLSLNESIKCYDRAVTTWRTKINRYYRGKRGKVQLLLDKTSYLLSSRRNFSKYMSYERYTLYALVILAAIGERIQKQRYIAIGLAGSAATLLFMLIHYGANAFIQSSSNASLVKSVKEAYLEVS